MNGIDECAFEMSNGMGRSIKIAKKKNKRQCEDNTIQTSEQTNNTSVD